MEHKVLVWIPVMNEGKTVKNIVNEITETYPEWDILVVDDDSNDNTVEEVKKTKAKLVQIPINTKGNGTAIVAFLIAEKSNYDFLLKIDGDGQQEVKSLEKLLQPLKNKEADISVGSRYITKVKETDSFLKVIGRSVSSSLINFKLKGKNHITDVTSGLRGWNAQSIKIFQKIYSTRPLPNNSTFWIVEDIIATKKNLTIKEVPTFYSKRKYGKSKSFSPLNMAFFVFRLLHILII